MPLNVDPWSNYLQALEEGRRHALSCPLIEGSKIRPLHPTSFDYQTVLGVAAPTSNPVRQPRLVQSDSKSTLDLSKCITCDGLQLVRKLSPQDDDNLAWGQVWLATTVNALQPHSDRVKLVVKLFQESLFPEQDGRDVLDGTLWTGVSISHAESWAFNTLKDLQGTMIPTSYGFFDFELPSDEVVCGHVMEYIQGTRLARDWDAVFDGSWKEPDRVDVRSQRMAALMDDINQIHKRGVLHGDLKTSNVIIPDADPDRFVFIDFASARSLLSGNYDFWAEREEELWGVMKCLQCLEECGAVYTWLAERMEHAEWRYIFRRYSPVHLLDMAKQGWFEEEQLRAEALQPRKDETS